jgi:hypothetical protein
MDIRHIGSRWSVPELEDLRRWWWIGCPGDAASGSFMSRAVVMAISPDGLTGNCAGHAQEPLLRLLCTLKEPDRSDIM